MLLDERADVRGVRKHLRAGVQPQRNVFLRQKLAQVVQLPAVVRAAVIAAEAGQVAVRRDGNGRDAALGGVARHGKRDLRVGRAVVHAGENMTMQVDHGPSFPRRGTAGRLWDRQMIS